MRHVVPQEIVPRDVYEDPATGKAYSPLAIVPGARLQLPEVVKGGELVLTEFVVSATTPDLEDYQEYLRNPPPPKADEVPVRPATPPPPPPPLSEFEQLMVRIRERITTRTDTDTGRPISINKLGRHFKILDDSGDKILQASELRKALKEYRLNLTDDEVALVLANLDVSGDGVVDYEEFLAAVRGKMNEARRSVVQKAFRKMDRKRDGVINMEDINKFYNAKNHPDVLAGKKTETEVLEKFLGNFDTIVKDLKVSFDEFCAYYEGVSVSCSTDEYFKAMMASAWSLRPEDFDEDD